jgi:3-hydroxyisobutyrate dehydrogenase-like beta-hydroxyacid dehydrogenase
VVLDGEAGIIAAERPPHTVLIHSTVHPDSARAAEEGLAAKNIACLDAAVTGGSSAADHSVLTCFVGGSAAALAAVRPVIDAYCRIVHLVGPVGAGQVAKLTNNVMSIINSVVAFEALAICDAWGIDPEGIRQAIAAGGTGSSRALAGTDESGFGTPWEKRAASLGGQPWAGSPGRAPKDLLLARSLAEAAGVSTPMLAAAIGGTRSQAH